MEESRFFKWIWRLNGLALFSGAAVILVFAIYQIAKETLREKPREEIITNVAEDPKGKEKWGLGSPEYISGTKYLMLPLVSENREANESPGSPISKSSYMDYRRAPAKNILFIESTSNRSNWLFSDTNRLVLSTDQLSCFHGCSQKEGGTKAIFYEIASRDTDADGVITYRDARSLSMSSPSGSNYVVVLEKYDKLISKNLVEENTILIIYQVDGSGRSLLIQIEPFKIISENELPRIENS